jgi:DNA-binding NarL/FixJ family response regulator
MMPGLNGLEIIRELRKHSPRTRVIVLSMHDTETYVLEALRAGAMGYVLKQSPPEEIVRAVLEVSAGRHFLTPSLQNIVIQAFKTQPLGMSSDVYDQLSPRERQVLSLTGEGLSREQIAKRLGIGVTTVATYRASLLRKLGLRTPADLIRYALERGSAKKQKRKK